MKWILLVLIGTLGGLFYVIILTMLGIHLIISSLIGFTVDIAGILLLSTESIPDDNDPDSNWLRTI